MYNLLAKDDSGNHQNYTALGEAFLEVHASSFDIRLGRQEMNTPWLNLHDVRMTPQSFDAVTVSWAFSRDMALYLCHVARMKYKTDTHAKSMSETAGFSADEGVSCMGLERRGALGLQLWGYRAHDMWHDFYLRLDYTSKDDSWYINLRYLDRNTTGDRLAGDQDTWHAGISSGVNLDDISLYAAYSRNGSRNILRKWGHATTISNQVMVADRAEEKAWLLGAIYRPSGVPALQLGFAMAQLNTPDRGVNKTPDRLEYDIDLKYSLKALIPGLELQGRYAWVDESGSAAEDLGDMRVYLRYLFEFK